MEFLTVPSLIKKKKGLIQIKNSSYYGYICYGYIGYKNITEIRKEVLIQNTSSQTREIMNRLLLV